MEMCYKIHGYPQGFKGNNTQPSRKYTYVAYEDDNEASEVSEMVNILVDQYNKMMGIHESK